MIQSGVTEEEALNLKLFLAELDTFIDGYECQGFLFPVNYMEGVHIDFQRLAEWVPLESVKDFDDMIARYRKFSAHADQIVGVLKEGVKRGRTNHAVSMV